VCGRGGMDETKARAGVQSAQAFGAARDPDSFDIIERHNFSLLVEENVLRATGGVIDKFWGELAGLKVRGFKVCRNDEGSEA
jgi:hypothetical protein